MSQIISTKNSAIQWPAHNKKQPVTPEDKAA